LTLDEALALARERNERIAIADEGIAQARATLYGAWLRLVPTLGVGGQLRVNDREIQVDVGGSTRTLQEQVALTGYGRASLTLFDARTVPGILEADAGVEVERAWAQVERYALLYAVTEAYLSVAIADNAVRSAARGLQTAQQVHRITVARVDAGMAPAIDALRAELSVTRARSAEIAAPICSFSSPSPRRRTPARPPRSWWSASPRSTVPQPRAQTWRCSRNAWSSPTRSPAVTG
jgi:outer membrane protein TolC